MTTTAEEEGDAVRDGVSDGVNVGERDSDVDALPDIDTDDVLPRLGDVEAVAELVGVKLDEIDTDNVNEALAVVVAVAERVEP